MGVLLRLQQADKAYGEQVLLDNVDLELTDAQRYAVIGRNGAGKSTLCKVLLDQLELDAGRVWRAASCRIAYLEQHDTFLPDETVAAFLQRDSGQADWRCGEVAGRFDLKGERFTGPVAALSGGWQTRVKLAAMLLGEPDFLILDEPTNFLDLRTQLLLERFLADWRGGALIVSHDRGFLARTCDATLEVDRGRCTVFPQGIDAYLQAKVEDRERLLRENANIEAKRKQLQTFVDQNRANANTASQARSKAKQVSRLSGQLHDIDSDARRAAIVVPTVEKRSGPALRCIDLGIGYPDKLVASSIDVEIERGSRMAVMGDNGQGKTTLLRTIAGDLEPKTGSLKWSHGSDIGIYAQHVFGSLPEEQTVRGYLEEKAIPGTDRTTILGVAGGMLFHGDAVDKPIAVLSGGERARLVLGGLLLGRHSVLILDEPTNHLDVESVEALATALTRYLGTVLFVSHDRHFAGQVATGVIELREGKLHHVPGSFATWLHGIEQAMDADASVPATTRPKSDKAAGRQRHELGKQIKATERRMQKWQQEIDRIDQSLTGTDDSESLTRLGEERRQAQTRLDAAEEEWLQAQEELETLG